MKRQELRINAKRVIILDANQEPVDFSSVRTVGELKRKILWHFVSICRKCGFERHCKLVPQGEDTCPLIAKAVENYIDSTIVTIQRENPRMVAEYINSIVLLVKIFESFLNWLGGNADQGIIRWFESLAPQNNFFWAKRLLVDLSQFVATYSDFDIKRIKKSVILVEGDSEEISIPRISELLGRLAFIPDVEIENLEGQGKSKWQNIKALLERYKKDNLSYYLLLDNDQGAEKRIDGLLRNKLIEPGNIFVFKKKFEDAFPATVIFEAMQKMSNKDFHKITLRDVEKAKKYPQGVIKEIDKILKSKGVISKISDNKKELSTNLVDLVGSLKINGEKIGHYEIVKVVKKIYSKIHEERKQFYNL